MAITLTSEVIVNTAGMGGTQTNTVTAHLANGGYVVAWQTDLGGQKDVFFQRYDSLGNAVGGPKIANSTTAGDQVLTDIVATADGRFTLAWTSGLTVTTRSFNGSTGNATSVEMNYDVQGQSASGAQLIATGTNEYKVVSSSVNNANTAIETTTITTTGVITAVKSIINIAVPGNVTIDQLVEGNVVGEQFALLSNNKIITTNNSINSASIGSATSGGDIIKLQDGTHVVAFDNGTASPFIEAFTGAGGNLATYSTGALTFGFGGLGGNVTTGADTFDKLLLNLSGGRILYLAVVDSGTSGITNQASDGIYASVYNTNTGTTEGTATLVHDMFVSSVIGDLPNMTLGADILSDGRVAVTWSANNGLTGLDVFTKILDARDAAVNVSGSSGADGLVGTAFDDTLNGLGGADVLDGAGGSDTTSYSFAATAIKVDLDNASLNSGEAALDTLFSIENVLGSVFDDELYGTAGANVLDGGAGNDKLFGREGNDVLIGGGSNDLADGGIGDDNLSGNSGNDTLNGGAGNDTMAGGGNDDALVGGSGNDTMAGDDGIDKLWGRDGDDNMNGGIGDDFLAGGVGADLLAGGADNDSINAGDGDDVIDGGTGNDLIAAGTGFNIVDGGTGTDAISYRDIIGNLGTGFYIDLAAGSDTVGNMDGFTADDDVLLNLENVFGSDGADYIAGTAGVNVLRGGNGGDTFLSRGGADKVVGGAGADFFLFENSTGGIDTIADFEDGIDKIQIVSAAFGDVGGGNIAAQLVIAAAPVVAANGNAQFLFDNAGANAGSLFFDADGNGAGAAVQIALLRFTTAGGLAAFDATDFAFI